VRPGAGAAGCAPDARLVEEAELRVDQSPLTGESHPVRKTAGAVHQEGLARSEQPNLVFAGTTVAAGTARAVVCATGMGTAFGTIAHLTQTVGETQSPLQREMARVTRVVAALATGIGALFFVLAVGLAGVDPAAGFVFAMGMIVAFVPEGMLPTVTLSLAMGVQRMAGRHALIKRLSSVEALGSCTVICTDKTGTLTQNEMTVRELWVAGRRLAVTGTGYAPAGRVLEGGRPVPAGDGDLRRLLVAGALCTNARLLPPSDAPEAPEAGRGPAAPGAPGWTVLGDPTEAALQVAALKAGVDLEDARRRAPRLRELPFESRRKRMTTVHRVDGSAVAYVKGSPREVLALCTAVRLAGEERPLGGATLADATQAMDEYARQGLRVLAVAERRLAAPGQRPDSRPGGPASGGDGAGAGGWAPEAVERDLTLLGLLAMLDPPRPEVAEAVARCHRAGIRIVMLTGDYGLTAESVARRIGIVRGPRPRIVSGAEVDAMDDAALRGALAGEVIFARVAPEHKLRVVAALQAGAGEAGGGHVVAVTGDGVNDAPALKQADIGVAMGRSGTDAAREAADVVLTDDNFASIVNAVEEGRAVYANIRRFAVYVFNSNMAEAVPFVVMLFSRGAVPLPLTVMQVLAIDLGTDMVPAIGLGAEAPEAGVMDRPPRSQREPLLTPRLLARALLWYGAIEAVAGMAGYLFLNRLHGWPAAPLAPPGTPVYALATTMTLACIVAAQVGAVFACRTDRASIRSVGLLTNRLVLLGVAAELALLGLLLYVPLLREVFGTAPLGPRELAFLLFWPPALLLADEARKALLRRRAARAAPPGGGGGGRGRGGGR
jgi:magnesium-transporting ATPase (P-type)